MATKKKAKKPVKAVMHDPVAPVSEKYAGVDKYKVEDAVRSMERLAELKTDPELMEAAKKMMREKRAQLDKMLGEEDAPSSLKELKEKKNKKFGKESEE